MSLKIWIHINILDYNLVDYDHNSVLLYSFTVH